MVELRHISGILFDDNKQAISFAEELKIISDIVDEMKKQVPYFELKLIITGLKIVGHKHVAKMMAHIEEGRKLGNLITGFDLVNEEDFTDSIGEFSLDYYSQKVKESLIKNNDSELDCFFHAGETHDQNNFNLHDAIAMGTKRIGHGF